MDESRRKTKDTVLRRHCRLDPDSEIQNFAISITGMYRRDAILRQVSEAVALRNAKTLKNSGIMFNCPKS